MNASSYARTGRSTFTSPASFYTLIGGMARWFAQGSVNAVLPMQRTSLRQIQVAGSALNLHSRATTPALAQKPIGLANPSVVRVIWLQEPGQPRASVGRMVMSGRMADVCAELDRLVAREAALH